MQLKQTFKIVIVGCGRVALKHIKALNFLYKKNKKRQYKVELIALVDPIEEAASKVSEAYKGRNQVDMFDSLEKMFAAVELEKILKPDIIAITTPTGMHYLQTKLVLSKKCHALIEKPITLNKKEAEELLLLAEKNNKKIAVGHIYRYFPVMNLLVKDLGKGKFGQALFGNVQVRWGHNQSYYDQADWRGTREFDGGSIMNQSIHAMDLMHWLLGEPKFISAKGAVTTQIHEIESEDLGFGIFEFDQDRWFVLEGTTNTDPARPEASFFLRYSKGEMRAGIINSKINFSILDDSGKEFKNKYIWQEIKQRVSKHGFSYLLQMGNPHTGIYIDLVESILLNKQPLADGQSGLHALEMVLALYEDAGVVKN